MSSVHQGRELRKFAPLAVPVACTLALLILLPVKVAVLLIALLTTAIGVVAFHLNNHLLATLAGAFLFRVVFIALDSTVGFLPTVPISAEHHQHSAELASAWMNGQFLGVIGDVSMMRTVMMHLLAPFYVILGNSFIAGRVGIAFVSLLVGYFIFHLAHYAVDRQTSIVAAIAVLFWPTIVYRSVVIQREVILVVALLAFLWASVQWIDGVTIPTVSIAIIATVATFTLRKENLFLIAIIIGFTSLAKARNKPLYLGGIAVFTVPFLAFFALNFEMFTGYGTTLSPATLDSFAYGRAHGDAVYLRGLHYETWLDVILYAPIKVVYFLYTPFPWHIRSVTELFVGMSAFALFAATLCIRRGIAILRNEPYYLGLLLSYFLTGVITYSIIEMNYGAAVRRRIQFIPILLLLATIGLSNVKLDIRWPQR